MRTTFHSFIKDCELIAGNRGVLTVMSLLWSVTKSHYTELHLSSRRLAEAHGKPAAVRQRWCYE